jgi:hypothetical protein
MEAPSFDTARRSLYAQLSKWCFVRVFRPCTVPPDGRTLVDGKEIVTYFHGSAARCAVSAVPGSSNKVWFKKSESRAPLEIGPLLVEGPSPEYVPRVGDILMGKMTAASSRARPTERAPSREENDRLLFWYPGAGYVETLLTIVCNGTTQAEQQLAHDLKRRVPGSEDDAWAVARLILFGNVAAFAEQHLKRAPKPMRLSCPPLVFVWKCANDFDDMTIWDKFVQLVPDAQPPEAPPQAFAPSSGPIVKPLSFLTDDFVGKPRRSAAPPPPSALPTAYGYGVPAYGPGRPPDVPAFRNFPLPDAPTSHPASPPFYVTPPGTPPGSPPYCPNTPPGAHRLPDGVLEYDPESPAYYPNPHPAISAESVLNLLRSVDNIKQQRGVE